VSCIQAEAVEDTVDHALGQTLGSRLSLLLRIKAFIRWYDY